MPKPHRVSAGYLLIIEWLDEGERKTGTELYELLKGTRIPMRLVSCRTKADIERALLKANETLLLEGLIPIIQLEAHGDLTGISPSRHSPECFTWKDLAIPLRRLNLISRFNLILIGAACHGFAAIKGFHIGEACPFRIVIGFSSTVTAGRLATTTREFHRELLCSGQHDVNAAIAAARIELGTEGTLDAIDCQDYVRRLVTLFARQELIPSERQELIEDLRVRLASQGKLMAKHEIEAKAFGDAWPYLEDAAAKWFAYEIIPENREKFFLDWDAIFNSIEA